MKDIENIRRLIKEHRAAARRARRTCCNTKALADNYREVLRQANDWDYIASLLEELIVFRSRENPSIDIDEHDLIPYTSDEFN